MALGILPQNVGMTDNDVACTTPHIYSFGYMDQKGPNYPHLESMDAFVRGITAAIIAYNARNGAYPIHRLGFVFGVLTETQKIGLALVKEFGFTVFESEPCDKYKHRLYMASMDCMHMHRRIKELYPEGYKEIRVRLTTPNAKPELLT